MTDSLPMPISVLSRAQKTSILNLVRRAAKTEIMPRFRRLDAKEIAQKTSRLDLVTEADRNAEKMIARGLLRMFPNAVIVGEEAVSENAAVLDKIAGAELCFTIDPVDGTWNFAKGLATFGVIVSALRFGKPVFGLIYDPVMDDVIWGDLGGPAEMTVPTKRVNREVYTSEGGEIADLYGYIPLYMMPLDKRAEMAATLPRFEHVQSLRCSAHQDRMLVQGHVDFVLSTGLTPWDNSAGVVLTGCAGGVARMLDGAEFNAAKTEGYLLCASDEATWTRLRDAFSFLLETPAAPVPIEDSDGDGGEG
ncbi:inositol monophosphatase [Salipiger sp. 1_MG-2023]|uniref:inositol monophosphatase family protein n=1 Tax=Salipiger sp. 1_MG-2023 TaxID=3062665 RepID=UPI0026E2A9D1|nr:inositol monophosphatase [Salipiger sp. 1_MG-2023]MDO6584250.1 inositol monophosphatase [Salipiger sp. 1_MG-2023]